MTECFLCSETHPPLMRFCKCRDLRAHPVCMRRTVETVPSHHDGCPVCGARYTMQVRRISSCRCHWHYVVVLDVVCLASLVLVCSYGRYIMWSRLAPPDAERVATMMLLYTLILLTSFGMSLQIRCARGPFFPLSMVTHDRVCLMSRSAEEEGTTSCV